MLAASRAVDGKVVSCCVNWVNAAGNTGTWILPSWWGRNVCFLKPRPLGEFASAAFRDSDAPAASRIRVGRIHTVQPPFFRET